MFQTINFWQIISYAYTMLARKIYKLFYIKQSYNYGNV